MTGVLEHRSLEFDSGIHGGENSRDFRLRSDLALVLFSYFTYYYGGLTLDNSFSRNTYPFLFILGAFESLHPDLSMYDKLFGLTPRKSWKIGLSRYTLLLYIAIYVSPLYTTVLMSQFGSQNLDIEPHPVASM